MADNETKPNERLEHLLRRWGANEAVRGADVSGLPTPQLPAVRSQWLWRWMPLAASIVLVAGAATVFLASHEPSPEIAEAPSVAPAAKAQIEKLKAGAAKLRDELAIARDQLAAMEGELADTAKLRADLARAGKQLDRSEEELAEALIQLYGRDQSGRNVAALQAALQKTRRELARQEARFKVQIARMGKPVPGAEMEEIIRNRVSKALKKLDRNWAAHQKEVAELKKQLAEVARERDAALEMHEKATVQHKADRHAAFARLREVYLSTAAPGKEGHEARQHAARKRRLLDRCAELRPKLRSVEQRKAFDAIEVLLTRLDLLDVHDEAAVRRFRATLRRVDVMRKIELAENADGATPTVNEWLLEVRFVLTEN